MKIKKSDGVFLGACILALSACAQLANLVADAARLQLEPETMKALTNMQQNWASVLQQQKSRWAEVAKVPELNRKELCLRNGDLVTVRMEMAHDQAQLLKAAARHIR